MVLSGQTIRKLGIITPFVERTVHPRGTSYGLSCAGYDIRIAEQIILTPYKFALRSSFEHFTMPRDVMGMVKDKSTLARLGLAVQNTVIEPGWRGHLTLEITNHAEWTAMIEAGEPIAQIIFMRLDETTEHPYTGKYQDQGVQAVLPIFEDVA